MFEIGKLFIAPLGTGVFPGTASRRMSLLGIAGLGLSLGSSLFGGIAARRATKKAMKENRYRTNAEKAWYEKEYNTDYLDTKAGQNLMRRAQEVQDSYIRKADGAAAVGGGTAASAALAKEAANRTMGNTLANIGAQDTARKASVSDQHRSNQQALSRERESIYRQQAQDTNTAAQNMSNAMMSAAQSLDGTPKSQSADGIDVKSPEAVKAGQGSLAPKVNLADIAYSKYSDKLKNVTGV